MRERVKMNSKSQRERERERERERVREMMPIITFAGQVKIEINFSPVENFRLFV